MSLKNGYQILKSAVGNFAGDDVVTPAAVLAFYAALSMAPLLLLILLAVTSLLGPDIQKQVIQQIQNTVGTQAGEVIGQIVQRGSAQRSAGWISAIVGFGVLLFSATGAFGQMQKAHR